MPPTNNNSDAPLRFEDALAELENILRALEDGTTSLDDSLTRYERGIALLRQCYGTLQNAEQKIRLLAGLGEDGSPDFKPFEHSASIDSARAPVRKVTRPS